MHVDEQTIYAFAPFAATLGVRFPELTAQRVRAERAATHELSTLGGGLHGGAIMSVCDLASAVCVALNIADGDAWSTAESTTYFLRPVGHAAIATATPIKLGRTLVTMRVELHDGDTLCAHTTQMVHVAKP